MDEGGNTKDDLGLPKGTDDAEKLADQIKQDFDDGKELVVTVVKVLASSNIMLMCDGDFIHCIVIVLSTTSKNLFACRLWEKRWCLL